MNRLGNLGETGDGDSMDIRDAGPGRAAGDPRDRLARPFRSLHLGGMGVVVDVEPLADFVGRLGTVAVGVKEDDHVTP